MGISKRGLVIAPHLIFPIKNGSDYLIFERWKNITVDTGIEVTIIGFNQIIDIVSSHVTVNSFSKKKNKSKFLSSFYSVIKKSHYLVEKFLNKDNKKIIKEKVNQKNYDFIVFSFYFFYYAISKLINMNDFCKKILIESHNYDPDLINYHIINANIIKKTVLLFSKDYISKSINSVKKNHISIHLTHSDFDKYKKITNSEAIVCGIGYENFCSTIKSNATLDRINLLFVGSFGSYQNHIAIKDFLTERYDEIKQNCDLPINLILAGYAPNQELIKLAHDKGVKLVANPSSEMLEKMYKGATFSIMPFGVSHGIKVKVIESLSRGVPILATNCVCFDDRLKFHPNLFSDKYEEWSKHINLAKEFTSIQEDKVKFLKWGTILDPLKKIIYEK